MATAAGLWQALARLAPRLPGGDGDLLARFADSRDGPAFHELMRRHGRLVWAACRRQLTDFADAEDAFQATWLVLATRPRAVRRGESLPSWLHGTAWKVSTRLRQQRRRLRPPVEVAAPEASDRREAVAALDDELARLPARLRGPLTACYLQELTQDEAAAALGLSVRTIQRRLTAGRDLLKARLTRRGIELGAALALLTLPARDAPATLADLTLLAATTGTVPAALSPLVTGVLTMIWTAKLKSTAAAIGMVVLTAGGIGTLAMTGHGQGPGNGNEGPPMAEKPTTQTKPAKTTAAKTAEQPIEMPTSKAAYREGLIRHYQHVPVVRDYVYNSARAKLTTERADLTLKSSEPTLKAPELSQSEKDSISVNRLKAQEDKLAAEYALSISTRAFEEFLDEQWQMYERDILSKPKPVPAPPASEAIRNRLASRRALADSQFGRCERLNFENHSSGEDLNFYVAGVLHVSQIMLDTDLELATDDGLRRQAWRDQQKRLTVLQTKYNDNYGSRDDKYKFLIQDAALVVEINLLKLGVE